MEDESFDCYKISIDFRKLVDQIYESDPKLSNDLCHEVEETLYKYFRKYRSIKDDNNV